MSLTLLGISHHTAPIEERERLAVPETSLAGALARLRALDGVRECLVLSTCNRVEIVVEAGNDGAPDLRQFLAEVSGALPLPEPERFYQLSGADVARHLFRVAASLDSLIVGEPQILGQLKQALAAARAAECIGPELDAVLTRALHAAKRVRTETSIAQQPVSISQAAVDLARQIFGGLEHKLILLIGAGAVGQDTARFLLQQGATQLWVANRTLARAQALAAKYRAEALAIEELAGRGEAADVVITCAGAGEYLIRRPQAAQWLSRRRGRPMLFLDLAVPRDVEPAVHTLENAFVYNVDDLDQVVESNLVGRREEAQQGEAIIEAELALYRQRRQARDLAPTLTALQRQAEALRSAEWERVRKRLGPLSSEQEAAIEALTRSLTQKFLHAPMTGIKDAAGAADREALMELIHRLFGLEATDEAERR